MPTLIIIEDEPDFASFIEDVARGLDFKTAIISNAADTSLLREWNADIITLDLHMPNVDGIEVIRELADLKFSGSLILMSGIDARVLQSAATLAKAHGLNVGAMLSKPVTVDELETVLSQTANMTTAFPLSMQSDFSESDIWEALNREQLAPYFQPKIDVSSNSIIGAEALIRWHHPEKGVLLPGQFMPFIKDDNLIDEITIRMLSLAIKAHKVWLGHGMEIPVAVNFQAPSFRDLNLPERIKRILDTQNLGSDSIVIEVTETSLVTDLAKSLDVLSRIRMQGVSLSIDDFGTGHSTFEQLQTIPFCQIKIDRRFVSELSGNQDARAIVRSMIELAKRLGMSCIAEGVETQSELDILQTYGCTQIQGYFVAPPMPEAEATDWSTQYLRQAA